MKMMKSLFHHTYLRTLPAASALLYLSLAFPLGAAAQSEDEEAQVNQPKKETQVKKKYATRTVSGRVLDAATHQPVSGAIVAAQGIGGYSVLTKDDGTYKLEVPTFTSALYVTLPSHNPVMQGLAKGEAQRDILVNADAFSRDYSRDIDQTEGHEASDFDYTNAINIKEEVQKQLGAFAYTQERSGMPGVGANIFIQGLNSLNVNAQPLIVVDGVIYDQQYNRTLIHSGFYNDILTAINPADIDKVDIVRNGTALYGAKGANGVILITTRRSKSMATRITASASGGVTMEPKFIDMMDAEQYRNYAAGLLGTTNTKVQDFKFLNEDPNYYYYRQYHNNTDWKDRVYHTAMTQNYGINIEGGDNVASYNLSVGYTNAQSTLKYNDMSRLNVRFNTDINIVQKLSVRFDASFSNLTRDIRDDGAPSSYTEGTPTSPSFLAYVKAPFLSPFSYGRGQLSDTKLDIEDESYLSEALSEYTEYNWKLANPWTLNSYAEAENKNRFENSMLNLTVTPTWKPLPNLFISEHFSYNLVNTNEKYYIPVNGVPDYYVSAVNAFRENEVRSLFSKQNSVMSDTRVEWTQRWDEHYLNLFGGVRVNWENYTLNNQLGYNTGSDKTPFMNSGLLNAGSTGTNDNWKNIAWYAQGNYNYLGRYFLQASLTAESSSRFGKKADGGIKVAGVKWGLFPSVQASWVLTNEPWAAQASWLNYLKLTAGFDISGNDDIDYYAARSYMTSKLYLNAISGVSLEGIGNTEIKWETTKRFNVGFDSRLLDNRLSLGFRYYKSWTDDLLAMQSIGYLSGLSNNWSNGGKLENTGFDVSAVVKVLNLKDWKWELGASLGHYKNKITELPDGQKYLDNTYYGADIRSEVGKAANLFYGYKTNGVFATTEEATQSGLYILADNGITKNNFGAGDMRFVDQNGDKRIDANDRVVIGDPNPDIYGNIFTSASWKRLKLDIRFNYSLGNDVYNYQRSQLEGGSRFMNQTTNLLARWQTEGQQTDVPKATFQDPMGNSRFSDRWIEDGSYLRLKTVTLSYNLPMNTTFIQGLQFWVQGNNLLTFTKYLGSDPEFSTTSAIIGQGVDLGLLGQCRSVVAGVKINL